MYTQNDEEKVILEYFGDRGGRLLDIGANDGVTFSNSRALIESGWLATLVEPTPECVAKLLSMYRDDPGIRIEAYAIGTKTAELEFYISGSLLKQGDYGLVSTLIVSEKDRWKPLDLEWEVMTVPVYSWADFYEANPGKYDFISIDAEGLDVEILKQIDLKATCTSLICVEYNNKLKPFNDIVNYASAFGFKAISYNAENLIMGL